MSLATAGGEGLGSISGNSELCQPGQVPISHIRVLTLSLGSPSSIEGLTSQQGALLESHFA